MLESFHEKVKVEITQSVQNDPNFIKERENHKSL